MPLAFSNRLSRILVGLFRFEIGLVVVSAIFYLLYPLVTGALLFTFIGGLILYSGVAWSLSTLLIIVLWPVWLYKFHRDLAVRFDRYPIRPWQTILWFFVPWYSVWGMLKHSKILTDHLLTEEDKQFQCQSYHAIDPRYQSWVILYIFFRRQEFKGHKHRSLGFRLLRIFMGLHVIWFCTFLLAFGGFGPELNFFAPAMILLFHNLLLQLPVFGWSSGYFPSATDILLKTLFIFLFLRLLIRLVRVSQEVVAN